MNPIHKRRNEKYCPYCLPIKAPERHYGAKLNYLANRLLSPLDYLYKSLSSMRIEKISWGAEQRMMRLLIWLGILKLDGVVPEEKILNRTLIFFKEGVRRGIMIFSVCFMKRPTQHIAFIHNGKYFFYRVIPLAEEKDLPINVDDKREVKEFLSKHSFPVPKGSLFRNASKAFQYGKNLGYPLVVKPNSGSLSRHVTYNITNDDLFKEAINIAKKFQQEFVVERHIQGKLFRIAVVNYSHVFVCEKKLANVIGNGVATIRELIEIKNKDPKRGDVNKKNTTLHKILINDEVEQYLKEHGHTPDTVPANGEEINLHYKYILSAGCDIIDQTSAMHPENKKMFLSVAEKLDRKIIGIDFICEDISRPYYNQSAAIIETNSLPYLDMHQFPSEGEAQPVAKVVWDEFLKTIKKSP